MARQYTAFLALVSLLVAGAGYTAVLADEPETPTVIEPVSTPPPEPDTESGLPIFKFNDNSWFELTIPETPHPETGMDIEAQRNKDSATKNSERNPLFSEDLEFLNQLQLRYQIRFK